MARTRSPQRLDRLIAAATHVFSTAGYRRAQMSDVAGALGMSAGTLYLYAENKEALFDLVLRHGLRGPPGPNRGLPMRAPVPGATLAFLRSHLDEMTSWPLLDDALQRRAPPDITGEVRDVLDELASSLIRHRWGLLVLTRSALDWPELAHPFLGELRTRALSKLDAYLRRRMRGGHLRDLPDPSAAAMLIHETLAFWMVHRLSDPAYAKLADETAERVAIDMLVHTLIKSP